MQTQEIAKAPTKKAPTIKDHLSSDSFKLQLAAALPKHCTPERFIRVALTATMKNPKLLECTQESFFKCMLELGSLGIEPDGRMAYLIPYRNSHTGKMEAQHQLDYKAVVQLVMNSGEVSSIHADVVRENDVFEYHNGQVDHRIDFRKPRGEVYAVYCIIKSSRPGVDPKSEVMDVEGVEALRKRSKSPNNGPWVTDWAEMAKKGVFRRASKWVPMSPDLRRKVTSDDDDEEARFERAKPKTEKPDFTGSFLPPVEDPAPKTEVAEQEPELAEAGFAPVVEPVAAKDETKVEPKLNEDLPDFDNPAESIKKLMDRDGIVFGQVAKVLIGRKFMRENQQTLEEVSDAKLRQVLGSWKDLLTEFRGVAA